MRYLLAVRAFVATNRMPAFCETSTNLTGADAFAVPDVTAAVSTNGLTPGRGVRE
jgi:hypothetical protein